ncbi:MAG: carbamoyltransferase HypF [Eggerthellaceae bacterium]|nr:carbamoyltransferase HypF [Eggerthellaceae bacterium]
MVEALHIHVKGIVQGVGFRPFVYRMAKKYLINGWVLNAVDGVVIHAEGEEKLLDEFVIELSENAPSAAQVSEIDLKEVPLEFFESFEIRFSDDLQVERTTLVSPDLAICEDCLNEMRNPNDRRYHYPFINCTNCGPRFTIIEKLPYDREHTSMSSFEMCPRCASEYADPADRRFHAQPDACFDCGPRLSWKVAAGCDAAPGASATEVVAWGLTRDESDAIIEAAARLIADGGIVAVKGLGGYHLACDANNAEAVAKLRSRKRREGKAFAVMMADADAAACLCEVDAVERKVLESPQRPIVLLRKRAGAAFVPQLADGLSELGVMLPYTPVQYLLMDAFTQMVASSDENPPMLVMTSGNLHDEPIVTSDEEAYERLAGVADAFLGNNRPILTRFDDSVVRVIKAGEDAQAVQFIRRARGYAPAPLEMKDMPESAPVIFATGPEQKNTFALLRGQEAFVSQHIGDMENAETYEAWLAAKARYENLFEASASVVACDMHPEYLSSKWAHEQDLPVVEVQHHHAHIAAVMAEHGLTDAVCGIAFDGTGYGVDGCIWGGEVMLANRQAFERFANFAYVPMPGGAAAIKNPLRMAYGVLWACDLLEHPAAESVIERLGEQAQLCDAMIEQGINTPQTSSVGRLFDAASAILGVCEKPTYEGEGAILLEAAMGFGTEVDEDPSARERYAVSVVKNTATETSTAQDTSVVLLDAATTFEALLDDVAAGVPVSMIARRFHNAFVDAIAMMAELVRGLYGVETVALAGGVFMNRYLTESVLAALSEAGFTAAISRDLPPNDGSIALGQAVIAWANLESQS